MKKKVLALLLSTALLCSSATVAFAADSDAGKQNDIESIEISGVIKSVAENAADSSSEETGILPVLEDSMNGAVLEDGGLEAEDKASTETDTEADDAKISDAETNETEKTNPLSEETNSEDTETYELASGNSGDLTWVLTMDETFSVTLTISGSGAMGANPSWDEYRGSIDKVVIEEGATTIGDYAFRGCYGLKEITIPDGVTSIGDDAFSSCSNLEKVVLPDSVTAIGGSAFSYCESLKEITLPKGLKSIPEFAFSGCTELADISIPDSVTSIGEYAFSSCAVTEIVIPKGVKSIEDGAFAWSGLRKVVIPDGVTSIGKRAFLGCADLSDIEIPGTVTSIGRDAFTDTKWIETAADKDGLIIVNNILIKSTSNKADITVPDTVTSIGSNAFDGSASLKDVVIPDNLTSIEYAAFAGCESLTSVDIPSSVTSIDSFAFYGAGLKSVVIPKTVKTIGDHAFGYKLNTEGTGHTKIEGFTIYGYPGTAAETYANENSFAFVALNEAGLAIVADKTDEVYIRYSGTGAVIYCTGDFDKFVSAEMDGQIVDPSNYTVVEGSTVLTFASAYLDTLATGRHVVTLNFIDGSISTYLTILDKDDAGAGNGSGTGISGRAPQTGDRTNMNMWIVLTIGSAAVCAAVLKTKRKEA